MTLITDPRRFLYHDGQLDPDTARRVTAQMLSKCDDGELYLQYRASESFGFDDGRLKTADYSTDAGFGLRSLEDLDALLAFFEARRGQLHAFRWKDWSDFKSCQPSGEVTGEDQVIGAGDEVTSSFQLVKSYASGDSVYVRPIRKPVAGTVQITVSGEPQAEGGDYALDTATGIVTFSHPPDIQAVIRAGYEFDVPVRFATDAIRTSMASFNAGEVPDVPVIEVRL